MVAKTFELQPIGRLTVVKNRANRNVRITISPEGKVRISIPYYAPYKVGIDFARSRSDWIIKHAIKPMLISHGQTIGKRSVIYFKKQTNNSLRITTRIQGDKIVISYPLGISFTNELVQTAAKSAAIKAIKKDALSLLPARVKILSDNYSLPVNKVKIKRLKSRWGSCDREANITLNLFLIQLPEELVDYVILHELAHTKQLNHSPQFWSFLEQISPDVKILRKRLKNYRPELIFGSNGLNQA
jgi:predicted metal-dependent hydrolase